MIQDPYEEKMEIAPPWHVNIKFVVLYLFSVILLVLSLVVCYAVRLDPQSINIFIEKDGPNLLFPISFGIGILMLLIPTGILVSSDADSIQYAYDWVKFSTIYMVILTFFSFYIIQGL